MSEYRKEKLEQLKRMKEMMDELDEMKECTDCNCKDDHNASIGDTYERIELLKVNLIGKLSEFDDGEEVYLSLINISRIVEANIYSAVGLILEKNKNTDEVLRDLSGSFVSAVEGVARLLKQLK